MPTADAAAEEFPAVEVVTLLPLLPKVFEAEVMVGSSPKLGESN